jgi:hypothetical protein
MEKDTNKHSIKESSIRESNGLLTAKEARSEIAKVFIDKRREINEEIKKVQQDETMTDEEKKVRMDELNKKLYDYIEDITKGYRYRFEKSFEKPVRKLQRKYWQSYIKRFQIKEAERKLKDTQYPPLKDLHREHLSNLRNFYENTEYI